MIADTLHAKKNEIYFTAGGSEGDNWALKEIADTYSKKGRTYHHDKAGASRNPAYMRIPRKAWIRGHISGCGYIRTCESGTGGAGNPEGYDFNIRDVCKQ